MSTFSLNNVIFGWLPFALFWSGILVLAFWLITKHISRKDRGIVILLAVLILGSLFFSSISENIRSGGGSMMRIGGEMGGGMQKMMNQMDKMEGEMEKMHKKCLEQSKGSNADNESLDDNQDHASHHKS